MSKQTVYQKLKCEHCGNTAPMEMKAKYNDSYEDPIEDGGFFSYGTVCELLKCPACNEITVRKSDWNDAMDTDDLEQYETLYPVNRKVPLGLPSEIAKGLEAAEKVKKIDANAYGVLVRRLLEMVCIDRNAKGRMLNEKLKDLASSGEIPLKLVEVALHLKDFGNMGAHAGLGDLTDEQVPILNDLCRAILEYVYSAPFLAQKAQDSLKAIKK